MISHRNIFYLWGTCVNCVLATTTFSHGPNDSLKDELVNREWGANLKQFISTETCRYRNASENDLEANTS